MLRKSHVYLQDLVLTFGDDDNGATIGVPEGADKNKITWDITGDTARITTGYATPSVIKSIRDAGSVTVVPD